MQETQRNSIVLVLTIVLSNLGTALYGAIFSVYLYELGASFTELALISALPNLVALLLTRFWGIVSDETHARKPFIAWSRFVTPLFILAYGFAENVKVIILLFIIATILSSPGGPAFNALITTIGGKQRRGRALGYFVSSGTLGWALGSFLSAYLVNSFTVKSLFIFSSLILFISAIIFASLYREHYDRNSFTRNIMVDSLHKAYSIKEFMVDKAILPLVGAMMIYNMGVVAFFQIFMIKYFIVINKNMALYAIVGGISSILSALAPPFYGYIADRVGMKKLLVIMMTIRTLYMALLAVIWDPFILTVLWVLPIWAGVFLSSRGLATEILGDDKAARAQGTFSMAYLISGVIGPLIAGPLADYIGARENIALATPIYLFSIILCLFAVFLVLFFVKSDNEGEVNEVSNVIAVQ